MDKFEQYFNDRNKPARDESSVHFNDNNQRLKKAQCQITKPAVDVEKIICYTNEFLEGIGMQRIKEPKLCLKFDAEKSSGNNIRRKEDNVPICKIYDELKEKYNLCEIKDIVWMKFTSDGYLGVVATSNDINFDIPKNKTDYGLKRGKAWSYNTSGILVHSIGKEWDTSFVLIFPLPSIPKPYNREDIERAIGNYLTKCKNVPVIDYYSHIY